MMATNKERRVRVNPTATDDAEFCLLLFDFCGAGVGAVVGSASNNNNINKMGKLIQ